MGEEGGLINFLPLKGGGLFERGEGFIVKSLIVKSPITRLNISFSWSLFKVL